jgi:hypothetical protein
MSELQQLCVQNIILTSVHLLVLLCELFVIAQTQITLKFGCFILNLHFELTVINHQRQTVIMHHINGK